MDTAAAFDNVLLEAPAAMASYVLNDGMKTRRENLVGGARWNLYCKVPSDLSHQQLPIPPKIDLKLVLTRSMDAYALLSSENPLTHKIVITAAVLRVKKVKLDTEFLLAHEMMLQEQNIAMNYTETNVLEFGVPQSLTFWSRQDVFRGVVPKKIILGLVESKELIGNPGANPPFQSASVD